MSLLETIARHLAEHHTVMADVIDTMPNEIADLGQRVLDTVEAGGTLYFCGNGGSAADAQHLAAEYLVRFRRERRPVAAIALTTDTSVLSAAGNDYGFETVFARQVEALARPGDLLVLHSTSGESENLVRAASAARDLGVTTVALLAGDGGRLLGAVDLALVVPTESTARAQEIHLTIGHIVCDIVEQTLTTTDGA
jgi:D-sedoheptulose 7-phosphate isomerase